MCLKPVGIGQGKLPHKRRNGHVGQPGLGTKKPARTGQLLRQTTQPAGCRTAVRQRVCASVAARVFVAVQVLLEGLLAVFDDRQNLRRLWRLWQPLPGVTVAKGPAHDVQALVYHLAIC